LVHFNSKRLQKIAASSFLFDDFLAIIFVEKIEMFNFLKKSDVSVTKIRDKVWMSENAKFEFLREELKKENDTLYIFWFDDTRRKAESFFSGEIASLTSFVTAREFIMNTEAGKKIIFAEHYPLYQKEADLFQKLHLQEAEIWSSLDEPLFQYFGGEKIISLMKKMGMKENEAAQHKMLTKAIQDAQKKIKEKVMVEQTSHSQKGWLEKNLAS